MAADIAKGAVACRIGRRIAGDTGQHVAAVSAVVGHCYPVTHGFRGGKGVATSVGQCLMTLPAYLPIDLGVATLVAAGPWRQRAFPATMAASATWVARICCDSSAQLDPDLAARHGIELDADAFWATFANGHVPEVSTAAPSRGQFIEAYKHLVASGATEIVSIHTGSDISATFDVARLASQQVDVPVELVDTGAASFVVGLATLAAAERLGSGGTATDAARAAAAVAANSGNVFVVGALDLARSGVRLRVGLSVADAGAGPIVEALRRPLAASAAGAVYHPI